MNIAESGRELGHGTCCLCLSEAESTLFHTKYIVKSMPLHEMVKFCIGIQIHPGDEQEQTFSTLICNECAMNINSFYSFKKKILEAQQLINSLNDRNEMRNEHNENNEHNEHNELEHPTEYVDDAYQLQMIDMNDDAEVLVEINNECTTENGEKIETYPEKMPKPASRLVQVENVKKRSNDSSNNQKASNKKSKVEHTTTEKITIQMNECLICPAILGDILELKDHIDAHTNIKCKACGRQFARYSNLKRHFNSTHSKPKPFQCDLCGLGFNFSVNLQTHAALHYSGKIRKE